MYVRESALRDVERVLEAISDLSVGTKAMVDRGDWTGEEQRAFLELIEPMDDLLYRVKDWLVLVDEGEDAWRGFLESHPELER